MTIGCRKVLHVAQAPCHTCIAFAKIAEDAKRQKAEADRICAQVTPHLHRKTRRLFRALQEEGKFPKLCSAHPGSGTRPLPPQPEQSRQLAEALFRSSASGAAGISSTGSPRVLGVISSRMESSAGDWDISGVLDNLSRELPREVGVEQSSVSAGDSADAFGGDSLPLGNGAGGLPQSSPRVGGGGIQVRSHLRDWVELPSVTPILSDKWMRPSTRPPQPPPLSEEKASDPWLSSL